MSTSQQNFNTGNVNFGLAACHMLTKMHRSPLPQTQGWVGGCQLVRATGNDRRSITGLVLEKEAVAQATVEGEAGASTIWCRAPLLNRDFNRENSIPFSACSRESNHRLSPYQVEAGVVSIIYIYMCVCVPPWTKGLTPPHHFSAGRGAVDHHHSLPNEDSDGSVVKQCGTPHCVPASLNFCPRCSNLSCLLPWSFTFPPPNLTELFAA